MSISKITSKEQHQKYLDRLKEIFDAELDTVESVELDELANIIDNYESINFPI